MYHLGFPYVKAQSLEQVIQKEHHAEGTKAFLWVFVSIFAFIVWLIQIGIPNPWTGVIFFVLCTGYFFLSAELGQGELIENAPNALLGRYSVRDLHQMVREVCQSFDESEIPNIYVVDTKEPLACIINVGLLNFIKPWNALYLGTYFLHSLEPDELKALLSHEICHYSKHSTFWSRYFYLDITILAIWGTLVLSCLIVGAGGLEGVLFYTGMSVVVAIIAAIGWYLIGWWVVALMPPSIPIAISWYLVWTLYKLPHIAADWMTRRGDDQEIEAICDWEAANRYGLLATVNMLLKVGTRSEVFAMLMMRFNPNEEFPDSIAATDSFLDRQSAGLELAIEHLEKTLPNDFLTVEESMPYIEEAAQVGIESKNAQNFHHRTLQQIHWLEYDTRVKDHKLDRLEFDTLIAKLKENPNHYLFTESKEEKEAVEESTHPSLQNRILFLEYNFRMRSKSLDSKPKRRRKKKRRRRR